MFASKPISLRSPLRLITGLALLAGLWLVASPVAVAQDAVAAGELGGRGPRADSTPNHSRVNRPLLIVGATLFVGSYGPSLAFATLADWNADDALAVPVAGPWMALANPESAPLSKALLINSGVMQGLGMLSIAASFVFPNYTANTTLRFGKSDVQISPAQVARGAFGFGALGSF